MNHTQALTVLAMIQDRNTYFKSLDITSQLTQLKSLKTLAPASDVITPRMAEIKSLIQKRELTLMMSLDVLSVLEGESWLVLLEGWNSMVDPDSRVTL